VLDGPVTALAFDDSSGQLHAGNDIALNTLHPANSSWSRLSGDGGLPYANITVRTLTLTSTLTLTLINPNLYSNPQAMKPSRMEHCSTHSNPTYGNPNPRTATLTLRTATLTLTLR
jgi:hypothetical protein